MNNFLKKDRGKWNFGGKVPKNFQDHMSRSVPLYSAGHDLILKISDFFLNPVWRSFGLFQGCFGPQKFQKSK